MAILKDFFAYIYKKWKAFKKYMCARTAKWKHRSKNCFNLSKCVFKQIWFIYKTVCQTLPDLNQKMKRVIWFLLELKARTKKIQVRMQVCVASDLSITKICFKPEEILRKFLNTL